MLARFFMRQFRQPAGFFGRLIGNAMARNNEYEAHWTVSLLDLQPDSRVLEVGFGPGVALQYASEKAPAGFVAGIDSSATMVQAARQRNAAALKAGRMDVQLGDVSALPFDGPAFDRAFAIHCIYFWAKPADCLKELRRVLKPDGLLAITILPKDKRPANRLPPPDLFTLYNSHEVAALLSGTGFREVRVEACPHPEKFPGDCILGVK